MITISDKKLCDSAEKLVDMVKRLGFTETFPEMYDNFRTGVRDIRELFHELGMAGKTAHFSDAMYDDIDNVAIYHGDPTFFRSNKMKKSLADTGEYMSHVPGNLSKKSSLRGPGYYFHSTYEGALSYATPEPGKYEDSKKRVLQARLSPDAVFFDKYRFHLLVSQLGLSKNDLTMSEQIKMGEIKSDQEKLAILGLLINENGLATLTSSLLGGDGFVFEEGADKYSNNDWMLKFAINNRSILTFPKKGYISEPKLDKS
ncbi:MAG: hypothetical protein FWE16_04520 [Firmicutes bacterium]|nr:hypothetical protein [Bacillota bacterium]